MAYIAYFGVLTIQKHNAFQTTAYDLGNVDQAVWNTRHGRLLAMTNIEGLTNRLGTHVEPILLPISLLYFVWSDPRVLLVLQTVVIALGAWPVYLLAKRAISYQLSAVSYGSRSISSRRCFGTFHVSRFTLHTLPIFFAFVYLMFPALQSANVFDFHAVSLAPTFFLFCLYYLETRRWGPYAVFAVLTMSTKEDMPLLVAMLGLYALVTSRGRLWRVAVPTIAVAAVWFVVAVGAIMPRFDTSAVSPFANRYQWLGNGPAEMARTLVTRPGLVAAHAFSGENLAYLRDWLAPVAFLGLFAPLVLLMAAPMLAVNLLSADGFMHQLEGFHYGAPLAPVAVVAAAYGTGWLLRRLPRVRLLPVLLGVALLTAMLVYHHSHGYTPLAAGLRQAWPAVTAHDRLGSEMARRIPQAASLAALPYLNPHASERQQLTQIERLENGQLAPLHDAEYVWLDVTNGWPLHPNDLKAGIEQLLADGYGVEEAQDGYLLLRRGGGVKILPRSFYSFVQAFVTKPQYPLRLQFTLDGQPALELLGFDLDEQKDGWVSTFYWRALQPLPAGLRLYPFYVDDSTGRVLEDTSLRPIIPTTWYPPEEWQPGAIVQTSTMPWPVGSKFSLGVGVVQDGDWSAVEKRLPIQVESSDLVTRLFDDNTWARLIHVAGGRPVNEARMFSLPRPQHPLAADFGPIRLLGYDERRQAGGREAKLTLYWQATERTTTSYTVFLQLLDAEGRVRGQVDAVPRGGAYPTMWWLPGEVVADPVTVTLAPDAPAAGSYLSIAGLYDAATGVRLVDKMTGRDFALLSKAW